MSQAKQESMAGFFSRTSLAEKLDIPLKSLTKKLIDAGWISYVDNKWVLTAKGDFEGGEVRQSKKYGEYIVWPAKVTEHQIFENSAPSQLSATAIANNFDIKARQVNALLAEQGLMERDVRGWNMTDFGRWAGGRIHTHEPSGRTYALWPQDIFDKLKPLALELTALGWAAKHDAEFLSKLSDEISLDGQQHCCKAMRLIGDWLYLAGIGHSCGRPLPRDRLLCSQFYLPDSRIYIELWGINLSPAQLAIQFQRQEYYERENCPYVSLSLDDMSNLDEILARKLLELSVESYQHL